MAQNAGTPQPPLTPTSTSGGTTNNSVTCSSSSSQFIDTRTTGTSQQFLAPGPVVTNNKPRPTIASPVQSPVSEGSKNFPAISSPEKSTETKSDSLANLVDQS